MLEVEDWKDGTSPGPTYPTVDDVVVTVWADGTGADVAVEGVRLFEVAGGQGLTPADIVLTNVNAVG